MTYYVKIDLNKTDTIPVLFKDNDKLEDFMKYYQETQSKNTSTDLRKLIKMNYATKMKQCF